MVLETRSGKALGVRSASLGRTVYPNIGHFVKAAGLDSPSDGRKTSCAMAGAQPYISRGLDRVWVCKHKQFPKESCGRDAMLSCQNISEGEEGLG